MPQRAGNRCQYAHGGKDHGGDVYDHGSGDVHLYFLHDGLCQTEQVRNPANIVTD